MKIIAGDKKGRNILTPKGQETRPTMARVRESLFSIIAGDVPGSTFYDMFSGGGAIGLEALSRGADKAIFVENWRDALLCLKQNIHALDLTTKSVIIQGDATRWPIPSHAPAPDIIFADPPYQPELITKFMEALEAASLPPNVLIILQAPRHYKPTTTLRHLRTAAYGKTSVHFYLTDTATTPADSPKTD